jgi:hypothetical protein
MAQRFVKYDLIKFLIAVQTGPGVPATIAMTDAIEVAEFEFSPESDQYSRQVTSARRGAQPELNVRPRATVKFKLPLIGHPTPGTIPVSSRPFRVSLHDETATLSEVAYETGDTQRYATIHWYIPDPDVPANDLRHVLTDCIGTVDIGGEIGSAMEATFTLSGNFNAPVSVAAVVPVTAVSQEPVALSTAEWEVYQNDNLPVNTGTALTYNARSMSITQGQEISDIEGSLLQSRTAGDRSGELSMAIFNPGSAIDVYADALANETKVIHHVVGSTPGKITEITVNRFKPRIPTRTEIEGHEGIEVTGPMLLPATGGEYKIVFK